MQRDAVRLRPVAFVPGRPRGLFGARSVWCPTSSVVQRKQLLAENEELQTVLAATRTEQQSIERDLRAELEALRKELALAHIEVEHGMRARQREARAGLLVAGARASVTLA